MKRAGSGRATRRLLDYADAEEEAYAAFLTAVGFRVLTRTCRGFTASS